MEKIWIALLAAGIMLAGCNSQDRQVDAIMRLENDLRKQKETTKIDTTCANSLIEKSLAYVAAYPADTLSPIFLFQAADVSRGIGRPEEAVRLWGRVNQEYPQYQRAADALFLQGFTCENNLSDPKRALDYYQAFVDKYPEHQLVKDVSLSIEYLQAGKDLDEVVKSFPKVPTE